jgi:hypothetical protein
VRSNANGWGGETQQCWSASAFFLALCAAFLHPGCGAGPLWKEEGLTIYWTRLVREFHKGLPLGREILVSVASLREGVISQGLWVKTKVYSITSSHT